MKIHGFPVRIVPGVECPTLYVKLVREHQLELFTSAPTCLLVRRFGGVHVNQTTVAWDVRNLRGRSENVYMTKAGVAGDATYLAGSIDTTQIKCAQIAQLFSRYGSNDRITNTVVGR